MVYEPLLASGLTRPDLSGVRKQWIQIGRPELDREETGEGVCQALVPIACLCLPS